MTLPHADPAPLPTSFELASRMTRRFPNESPAYRDARLALLAEEIELRRHVERVAAQRRALPAGGEVPQDYVFMGPQGAVLMSELFGMHDTLIVYHWMFGPRSERPCPMCTSLLSALDGETPDLLQRTAFVVVARSPYARLANFAIERGWRNLPLLSTFGSTFNQDYVGEEPEGDDVAGLNVFRREGNLIRHFWGEEMGQETADKGQDARGAPDLMPLWTLLDKTPQGRGRDWHPSLSYDVAP
ncbi:DUF899 family protein [Variovorax sp.]|uniref:DUF899 family protein n=1 Tax=Variovorax sp. TaxID=1871043 RepID=UPI002D59C928|nr:DUF899 family protein [Variovorax sp.]HYP83390.1 DUF899 family protein [Variovorax sp.]